MKKLGSIVFGLFFIIQLSALTVYINNDNADMINEKKICVRLGFDRDEAAIYRDTLCISVDDPGIELKGWRTLAQSPVVYVASFKKNKRLFTESFNLEILIDFENKDKGKQLKVLQDSYVSFSFLILTKSGKNKAENVVVPLKVSDIADDLSLSTTSTTLGLISAYTSTLLPYQRSFEYFNSNKRLIHKQNAREVLVIDRTKDLWGMMRKQTTTLFASFSFYKWYLFLWVLGGLLILGFYYPRVRFFVPLPRLWRHELLIFVSILLVLFSWSFLRARVAPYIWYGVMGIFCIPGSFYYLWGGTETFLDRFKVLIGIIFAVSLLPLFALACMYDNFGLLMRLLK